MTSMMGGLNQAAIMSNSPGMDGSPDPRYRNHAEKRSGLSNVPISQSGGIGSASTAFGSECRPRPAAGSCSGVAVEAAIS